VPPFFSLQARAESVVRDPSKADLGVAAAPAMGGGAGALAALVLRGGPLMSPPASVSFAAHIFITFSLVYFATYQWLEVDI
jgi:hypothetical protein